LGHSDARTRADEIRAFLAQGRVRLSDASALS